MTLAASHQGSTSPFRILVVEDEMMIALCIEQCLTAQGHTIVGPVGRLTEAHRLAEASTFDFAMLDINVAGEVIYPVAVVLKQRRIPFVFLSGHDARTLRPEWKDADILEKPFRCSAVEAIADAARCRWRAGIARVEGDVA